MSIAMNIFLNTSTSYYRKGDFMNKNEYVKYTDKRAAKSPCLLNCIKAFFVGGLICLIGQGLIALYEMLGIDHETASPLASVTLVFLAGLLTGIGVFDKIAKFAGAGTLVPITGFSNAVASPAIEAKSEGFVNGVGVKMFIIAGPVIVYGTLASVIYGIIYYFATL